MNPKISFGFPFLFCFLFCSNYATKSKTELLYFGSDKIQFDTSYSFPYSDGQSVLHIQTRQSSGTSYYRAKQPLSDSFFLIMRALKDSALTSFLKVNRVKLNTSVTSCGYMDLLKLNFSFLDTSLIILDSIKTSKDRIHSSGLMFIRILKTGETDLKVVSYDTTFFVHFKIDTSLLLISNTGYFKRRPEKAFLWFTWPIENIHSK